jgi:CheY-like chemotaxis protein
MPARASSARDSSLSTILVVEDDPDIRHMFRLILERAGHEVVEAADGDAAMVLTNPGPLPDLITTDLTMPFMSGECLIERLRSEPRTASIPIVVVSANPAAARALEASGLVDAVLIKPFNPFALESCVRTIAGAGRRDPGANQQV